MSWRHVLMSSIIVSRDPESAGYVVNNFETGEWMSYTAMSRGRRAAAIVAKARPPRG